MKRNLRALAAAGPLSLALFAADAALAQKSGGILKLGHFDSPASMSMLEESTQTVNRPMSGVFNNLVMFKQDVPLHCGGLSNGTTASRSPLLTSNAPLIS